MLFRFSPQTSATNCQTLKVFKYRRIWELNANMKKQVFWQEKDINLLRTVLTRQILVWREARQFFDHVSNRESSKRSAMWKLPITKWGQVWLMVVTLATTRHHIEVLRLYIPIPWLLRCNHFFFFIFCFILGYCSCFKKDVTSFGYDMRGREREPSYDWVMDGQTYCWVPHYHLPWSGRDVAA